MQGIHEKKDTQPTVSRHMRVENKLETNTRAPTKNKSWPKKTSERYQEPAMEKILQDYYLLWR